MDYLTDEHKTLLKEWLGVGSINVFGLPFAGKDSQGRRLSEFFDGPLIGGGDILRNSVIPERVQQIMNQGKLIPTEDYLNIVLPYLSQPDFADKPLILSAVGRWHGEEPGVIEALTQSNHHMRAAVFLDMDEAEVWRRWEANLSGADKRGQRHDDQADSLEVRLEEFQLKTRPVIEFYRDNNLLIEVDGGQSKTDVQRAVFESLLRFAS